MRMRTPYQSSQAEASQATSMLARDWFYPDLFPGCHVDFEGVEKTTRDLEYAIDLQLAVTPPTGGFHQPLVFSVQERWRQDKSCLKYQDVTITEWNALSDTPSELHKMHAHIFVYGVGSPSTLYAACAFWIAPVLHALLLGKLPYERRSKRGEQDFICIKLADLRRTNAVLYERGFDP